MTGSCSALHNLWILRAEGVAISRLNLLRETFP
jgi:hypothetical protein